MKTGGFKYGVSLYSYTEDFGTVLTLEDAFEQIADLGATGIEILGEAHVPEYPDPPAAWIDQWQRLLEKYRLEPTNYGSWIDTRLRLSRNMTAAEGAEDLARDVRLAARLGFKFVRPKIGVVSFDLVPDPIWEESVTRVLDLAAKSNIVICPEIHAPTPIRHKVVDSYVEFIERTGTKHFGLLIDTGIFQDRPLPYQPGESPEMRRDFLNGIHVDPADFLLVAKYVVFIQAKFHKIDDELHDEQIPWERVVPMLKKAGYTGYLSSEYEGEREPWRSLEQVRRQHALIRKLEREYDSGKQGSGTTR
jgi:sugar phosphate isomerase/epimerase